ncbi:MAG: DpnI domain-containing protein [Candidatus Acidiferrales bacterium]
MQLQLPRAGLERYKSNSQRARIATETWASKNLYCLNCASDELSCSPPNTAAVDYACPNCEASFQLKAQSHSFGGKILDAAYATMLQKIRADETPNLVALHYDLASWTVRNVFLVPEFAFSISAIEKRKPLSATARRAGWVGCNILLTEIPSDARILLVTDGKQTNPSLARKQYAKVRPLSKLRPEIRGWTLDVLNLVRSLHKQTFSLSDAYSLEPHLASLHPSNRHVRDKIRQQLQILRDLGLLQFLARGHYRLR